MVFQPLPDGALAVIEYGNDTLQWTNTLWFTKPGLAPNDLQLLASDLVNWAELQILPSLASQYFVNKVTVYDMTTVTGQKWTDIARNFTGGRVGATGALNAALVVTFYSTIRGRSGRGRNYITGFIEDDMTNVNVNPVPVGDAIALAYTQLPFAVNSNGFAWVIAQRYENGVLLPQIVPHQVVSSTVRSTQFGSQRRRVERP